MNVDGDGGGEGATSPTGLVLQVEKLAGGPLPYPVPSLPRFVLYGNGRVFTPAPQIAVYPGPALPAFTVARTSPERVAELAEAVEASGILERVPGSDDTPVADAGVTVVTLVVDGEPHTVRLEDGRGEAPDFDRLLADLPVTSDTLYEPAALGVFPVPALEPEEGIEAEVRDWPLGEGLAGSDCLTVAGAEIETVLAAAGLANQLTRWRSGAELFGVAFRPLLPHETSCGDVLVG